MIQPKRYFSYLLRLWSTDVQGQPAWRASLESPHTGERLGFASLERLFAFLADQTTKPTCSDSATDDTQS